MRVHLCGVRGSTPAVGAEFVRYGGHTSCVAVAHDGAAAPSLILDAGTGLHVADALIGGAPFCGAIVLTHLHWDHVQGLPFFGAGDRDGSRVTLLLPQQEDGAAAAEVLARFMSPPHFPIEPAGLRSRWTFASLAPGEWRADGFHVLACEIPQKGGVLLASGSATAAPLSPTCPTTVRPRWAPGHTAGGVAPDRARACRTRSWSGRTTGTPSLTMGVELARRAGARAVALCHHAPDRTDDELDSLAARFDGLPAVSVTAQGMVLEL